MKLTLSSQDGVAILSGTDQISTHDLAVLKAGITKLFQSGKNRIVLELLGVETIPSEIIREISKFDLLARELSGRIVLAGKNDSLRKQVLQFALPPIIECFDGRDAALLYFKKQPSSQHALAPGAAQTQDASKAEIRQKELHDLVSLRERVSQLENENRMLQQQLLGAWLSSRLTGDPAHQAEIKALNERMIEVLNHFQISQPSK